MSSSVITSEQVEALIVAIEDGSLRKAIEATLDSEWLRQYGDAAWGAVMVIHGRGGGDDETPADTDHVDRASDASGNR